MRQSADRRRRFRCLDRGRSRRRSPRGRGRRARL